MRMRPIRLLASTALVLTAVSGQLIAQTYPPDIPEAEVRVYRSVDSVDLNVWILYPQDHQTPEAAPAMIFFFGGGFVGGSPRQFLPQAPRSLPEVWWRSLPTTGWPIGTAPGPVTP